MTSHPTSVSGGHIWEAATRSTPSLGRGQPRARPHPFPWAGPHPFPWPRLCVGTLSPQPPPCGPLTIYKWGENCLLCCLDPSMGLPTWWSQPSGAQTAWFSKGPPNPSAHPMQHPSRPHLITPALPPRGNTSGAYEGLSPLCIKKLLGASTEAGGCGFPQGHGA